MKRQQTLGKIKKIFLVPSARLFWCGRPAGPSFLAWPRNEAKEGHPTKHECPFAADNRVGGGRDWLAASLPCRNPAPLVPRYGVFQGDFKALCRERGYCVFLLFATKTRRLSAHGLQPADFSASLAGSRPTYSAWHWGYLLLLIW
jgi:hypothetical protein